jgi:hypothetical protein
MGGEVTARRNPPPVMHTSGPYGKTPGIYPKEHVLRRLGLFPLEQCPPAFGTYPPKQCVKQGSIMFISSDMSTAYI